MTKSRGIRIPKGTRPRWVAENQGQHPCQCGCGQHVQLRPEHYPNAPRFIHGHNQLGVIRVERPPAQPCECGCDQLANVGKRFLPGHNGLGQKRSEETRRKLSESKRGERNPQWGKPAPNAKPSVPPVQCACGCGAMATPGRAFVSGHNGRGQRLSNYTGRYVSTYHGYVFIDVPDHPYAQKGYVVEHRIAVERHLRETAPGSEHLTAIGENLYLSPDVVVHHINGVKDDNRLENLQAMSRWEHTRLHHDQGDIRG